MIQGSSPDNGNAEESSDDEFGVHDMSRAVVGAMLLPVLVRGPAMADANDSDNVLIIMSHSPLSDPDQDVTVVGDNIAGGDGDFASNTPDPSNGDGEDAGDTDAPDTAGVSKGRGRSKIITKRKTKLTRGARSPECCWQQLCLRLFVFSEPAPALHTLVKIVTERYQFSNMTDTALSNHCNGHLKANPPYLTNH